MIMQGECRQRPLVLVVDGEREVLEQASVALAEAHWMCQCCASADEAIAAARANPPDLILCDLYLRAEGGLEVCRKIKRQPGLAEVPVMFLSSAQRPDVLRRSFADGESVYCLRKPFASKVLIELIDQSVGVAGA